MCKLVETAFGTKAVCQVVWGVGGDEPPPTRLAGGCNPRKICLVVQGAQERYFDLHFPGHPTCARYENDWSLRVRKFKS
jgi:hypothetical protein